MCCGRTRRDGGERRRNSHGGIPVYVCARHRPHSLCMFVYGVAVRLCASGRWEPYESQVFMCVRVCVCVCVCVCAHTLLIAPDR